MSATHSGAPGLETDQFGALRLLLELTDLPTAAGRERRVIDRVRRWVAARPDLRLREDLSGNLVIERDVPAGVGVTPLFFTGHLDHPAFVLERIVGPGTVEMSFRGGVMDPYFRDAVVEIFPELAEGTVRGRVIEKKAAEPFHLCLVELQEKGPTDELRPGDVGRWLLPAPELKDGLVHTHACDDLAAVAAALVAMDRLRAEPGAAHVKVLLTRAEEIGFIGAIVACKLGTMEKGSRVLALENSRSFAESPIGGGPIVRVGDRISTFSPALTGAVAKVAEALSGRKEAAIGSPRAPEKPGGAPVFQWQRKLMAGGACEASAYQAYGYDATCICLPLGNYHNMSDLERVQAGDASAVASARVGREFISFADYLGLIELLVACATGLAGAEPIITRMESLYAKYAFVLEG